MILGYSVHEKTPSLCSQFKIDNAFCSQSAPVERTRRTIPLVLVANKCDLPVQRHTVPTSEARRAALETNAQHKAGAGASFVEGTRGLSPHSLIY